jgi:hypothetical protein
MGKEQGRSVQADGAAVLQEVVQMTGLPEEYLGTEISQLLGTPGDSVNHMTLDQLRSVLLNYLETVNEEMNAIQPEKH